MAETQQCRIVFMGTPAFAAEVLAQVARWPGGTVLAVYTQPDRPAGRGHKLTPSPVKVLAQSLGLPVLQPLHLKNPEDQAQLAAFAPDVLVVAAYGLILPDAVLALPRLAPVNVHASLLPSYRGAAPIQRAIMDGCAESGVSIMRIVSRLDAGPVYAAAAEPLARHTASTLHTALAALGGRLLLPVLADLHRGRLEGTGLLKAQDEAQVSYAAKITKADCQIVWDRPAEVVHAHIRAVSDRPGAQARFVFSGKPEPLSLILLPGTPGDAHQGQAPGTLRNDGQALSVACADAWYHVADVRPQGKSTMSARAFLNGLRLPQGLCGQALPFD